MEKKLSRSRRKHLKTQSIYRKRVSKEVECKGGKTQSRPALSRGPYFKAFREERKLVRILTENPPSEELSRKNRRILRRVYYCLLPVLFSRLHYYKDLSILWDIEVYYYDLLNRVNLNRGVLKRADRLRWELRHLRSHPSESLTSQAKLY